MPKKGASNMENNVFPNDNLSGEEIHNTDRIDKLERCIDSVFDAVVEIDLENNMAYQVYIKKGTLYYKEFGSNRMSYSRLCRLMITGMADSTDVERLTNFLNPERIKSVKLDRKGKNKEKIQFRTKDINSVLWKECSIIYYRDGKSVKRICTLKDITNDKNFEVIYNAQSRLMHATQNSEREILKGFIHTVNNLCDKVLELNYTNYECYQYDFSNDVLKKKGMDEDLKEYIKYLSQDSVYYEDVQRFLNFISIANITELAQKGVKNTDIKLRIRENSESDYEWYVLTGILTRNENKEIILTLFCNNINKSETEKIKKQNVLETYLLAAESKIESANQYKNAFLKNAYFCIYASVDNDLIKEDVTDINGNSLLKTIGFTAPCKLSEFSKKWLDRYVIKVENSEIDTSTFNLDILKETYKNGSRFYKGEYKTISTTGKIIWLECYTMLLKTESDNELMMLHYALDITSEKRKSDNYKV